ncbi:MAG: sel1 repeat family protein [Pseudorhodoplanes sp.]
MISRSDRDEAPLYYTTVRRLPDDELRRRLAGPPEQAAKWVYAAATGGSAAAQVTLGQMLLDGHGLEPDPQAACRWFAIAARSGDLDGINMLARCYENGWGIAADRIEARKLYERAAAKSHGWGQFNLGMMLLNESGHPGDVATALTLFVRSARQGNAKAMNIIGRYREFGWVGRIDPASAMRWYRRAAKRGCFRAASHLARFLLAQEQAEEAAGWYRQSADTAPVHFCRDLAAHLFGSGRPDLYGVARHSLRRAAESDEPDDLFAYGLELVQGRGGPVELNEAAIWLGRAETKGFPGALALVTQAREKQL